MKLAGRDVALASHDDRTPQEVADWREAGITISEFPVTAEAARAARAHGMGIIAGAPNIVRGGSHSGNVRAADLLAEGLVDVFASDYVPAAMLAAAMLTHQKMHLPLPAAIATVSQRPALMVGLSDRGAIAPGLRADLVQVQGAGLENGLLHISLKREVPEALKPRTIPVNGVQAPKTIEARKAA